MLRESLPNHANERRIQFGLRTLFVVTTIVAVPFAGYVLWNRMMEEALHAFLVGKTGPVTSRDDWPGPLKELINEPEIKLNETTVQVHCLCQGWDPEYVWRMEAGPGVFEHIKNRWKLTATDANWHIYKGFSHNSGEPTPAWWSPKQNAQTLFFACPRTLGGNKSDRFLVALDQEHGTIFVHYWYNF